MKLTALMLTMITTGFFAQGSTDLVENLRSTDLKDTSAFAQKPATRQEQVLRGLSYGVPPSREGIPGQEEEPNPETLLNSAYKTSTLIRRALENSNTMPFGQRLQHFENQARRIMELSATNPMEEGARLVLNRSVDIVQTTVQWSGQNPELIATWLVRFYENSFKLALAYVNNPPMHQDGSLARAQVGLNFSSLLWKNQAGLTSDTSKAILLLKLAGFLGQDLNLDLHRRDPEFKETLADIYDLQNNYFQYQNILKSLSNKQEVNPADVRAVRSRIDQIMQGAQQAK